MKHIVAVFLVFIGAACTAETDLTPADCELGGEDGLPPGTSSSSGGTGEQSADTTPCGSMRPADPWQCAFTRGQDSGVWQWGGLGAVSDAPSAEKQCEIEEGPGSDCFSCALTGQSGEFRWCECYGRCSPSQSYVEQHWVGEAWNAETARGKCNDKLQAECTQRGDTSAVNVWYNPGCY